MTQTQPAPRGRLADNVVDRIRERATEGIVDLISEYVSLKPSGNNTYKGLCPFHDERTPSFNVNATTGRYHCFGCGEDGDGLAFVQDKIAGGDFRFAAEYLADKYGIGIEVNQDAADNRARLRAINEEAKKYFSQQLLQTPPGHPARELLENRGFNIIEAVERFGCGYAPDASDALLKHLHTKNFKTRDIIDAGLARESEKSSKPWDYFRNRLLWTITSQMGHTIGFGARRIDPEDRLPAKFINTPETELYKKSQVLFGLADARKAISKAGRAIVVEGYTDVMAMHLSDVPIAVAACGTAFTADHLNILRRLVGEDGEITFALDDDVAGISATMKVYDLSKDSVKRLTVMPPSEGMDPDEYRQAHGPEALAALVERRTPLIGTVIQNTLKGLPQETIEDRIVALDKVKDFFNQINDPLLRSSYAKQIAKLLQLEPHEVEQRLRGNVKGGAANNLAQGGAAEKITPSTTPQTDLAALIERDISASLVQSEAAAQQYAGEATWSLSLERSKNVLRAVTRATQEASTRPWHSRLEAHAGSEVVKRDLSMLAVVPLDVSNANLPDHVNELLDRLEDERQRQRRNMLTAEFATANPERKLQILKDLGKGP